MRPADGPRRSPDLPRDALRGKCTAAPLRGVGNRVPEPGDLSSLDNPQAEVDDSPRRTRHARLRRVRVRAPVPDAAVRRAGSAAAATAMCSASSLWGERQAGAVAIARGRSERAHMGRRRARAHRPLMAVDLPGHGRSPIVPIGTTGRGATRRSSPTRSATDGWAARRRRDVARWPHRAIRLAAQRIPTWYGRSSSSTSHPSIHEVDMTTQQRGARLARQQLTRPSARSPSWSRRRLPLQVAPSRSQS